MVKFGVPVAVSKDGETLVIGAPHSNGNRGAAYVFSFDGTEWREEAKLIPHDGAPGDGFGLSVEIDGNTIVVGSVFGDDGHGASYVFEFSGTMWVEQAKLAASDRASGDHFGMRVDVSGNAIVVGALADDDAGSSSGSAYVFRLDTAGGPIVDNRERAFSTGPSVWPRSHMIPGHHGSD
jgi:hypothetical protein